MSNDDRRALIRKRDIGALVLLMTLFGLLFVPLKKVFQMNDAIDKVAKLEERANESDRRDATTVAKLDYISKQLDQINWQLRRLRP